MPSQGAARQKLIAGMMFMLMVFSVALTGCKKNNSQTEAGEISPASALSEPEEVGDQSQPAQPLGNMKGLSVQNASAEPTPVILPDMKVVAGTDISVRLSQRMMATPGWTQNFANLYKPVSDCLGQTIGGAAYAASVGKHSADLLSVKIVGLDGQWQECLITTAGGQAVSMTAIEPQAENDTAFYPRSAGKPVIDNPQCVIMEPVVARPGGLIGWLAFHKSDCAGTNP